MKEDMQEYGVEAGIYRIRRLRKKLGIKCKQVKKFRATTDSDHELPVADNLLEQRFEATEPNKIWVSDNLMPCKVQPTFFRRYIGNAEQLQQRDLKRG